MKKIFKSRIFFFSLGLLVATTVSVGATALYSSSEIGFTPTDSNWHVNNLEDAINDLYDNKSSGVTKLVYEDITRTDTKHLNIDIKNDYADYDKITIDNIAVQLNDLMGASSSSLNHITFAYDNTTGIISITSAIDYFSSSRNDATIIIYK